MENYIGFIFTAISITFSILAFAYSRRDKSNKDTEDTAYKQGVLDQKLSNIFDKLEKIERKLDTYDNEIDAKIEKAIDIHLKEYHKRGAKKNDI